MSLEGVLEGFVDEPGYAHQLVAQRINVADDVRARLLRRGDDARRAARYDLDRFGIVFRPARDSLT